MSRTLYLTFCLLLIALACRWSTAMTDTRLPTAEPTQSIPSPTSTAIPPPPTPMSINAAIPSTPTPGAEETGLDLTPYKQAMLPQFVTDVETVATAGASRYDIEVTLKPSSLENLEGLHLSGTEQIIYTNTETAPLEEIYFRLYPNLSGYGGQMEVDSVTIEGQSVAPILEAEATALRVPLPASLSPGESTEIELTYQAIVPVNPQQGYNIFSYTDSTAALAGFYPTIAVYDDEGWNIEIPPPYGDATYLDISLYSVQLTVPQEMVVAASGSLLEETPNSDGTKTLRLVSGPMRDFYLVMHPNFQVASEVVDGTVVNSYYPPDLEAGGQLALRYAADSLRLFNQHFGQYPYAEFDVVATPTTAGGVEYPGIVVVSERVYNQQGGFFQHATVHEVAHQWWYGLVGNDQVDEPWLDESLTNYSAVIYWEAVEGQDTADLVIENFFLTPYQRAKSQGRDHSVIGPVEDFTVSEYSTFVYGKGSLFFDALREQVGDETYFKIMRTYYAEYKYKIATAEELFTIIEQISGQNIEPLLETWLQTR